MEERNLVFGASLEHYKYAWIMMESAFMSSPQRPWTSEDIAQLIHYCRLQSNVIVASDNMAYKEVSH
jgi:hypothetical protein